MALAYAEMVVAEEVPACRLVIKACQRYLRMLGLAETEQEGFYFSFESAIEACAFVESLAHIKGDKAREPFIMEPWQIFKTCAVFGFRWAESGTRVVNTVYLEEPRKHGKAEWIENLIPTTTGLKRMADIEVGDMVFAIDGTPTKVLATSPIWASRPCLEVEFSSGEKIIVDENHEWMTEPRRLGVRAEPKTAKRKTPGALGRSRIYETREIRDSLRHGSRGNNNHFVPLPSHAPKT